jgi:hypothetical protein
MNYSTVEVLLEDGVVRPSGSEQLPKKARGLLTVLDSSEPKKQNCEELADWWSKRNRLSPEEANAFADDIEEARRNLPPLKSAWD